MVEIEIHPPTTGNSEKKKKHMSAFSKRPFDHRRSLHQPLKNPVKSTKQTNGSQPEEPW